MIRDVVSCRFRRSHVCLGFVALLSLAAWAGCQVPANVRLIQPQLAGRQREMVLATEQVYWVASEKDGGEERVLAEFPLPMATTGRPMYLLYLRVPSGKKEGPVAAGAETKAATQPHGDPLLRVRGFLIQTRGEYAGLANVVGGAVVVTGTSQSKAAKRDLQINLTCEDGTRVVGRLSARRDDWHVRYFETRRHPMDVQALIDGEQAAN